jgi:Predicted thiamine-pyrophosphate-binding protein
MNTGQAQCLIDALNSCGVKHIVVVPASGLEAVFGHFQSHDSCIYATREEEAVAIAAGLSLGGEGTAVLMAQAGVGNALNAVFTLADAYGIYFPILVCFRGKHDPNVVQRVSAKQTHLVLDALDCAELFWDAPSSAEEFKKLVDNHQRWIKCSL